jgi:preprotein translocase subunit SecG
MFALFVVLIAIVAFFIILIVLLQSGKGGGLAAEFGGASSSTDSVMGSRQTANVLTKASWIGGGVFMALALILAIMSSRSSAPPSSILRSEFQTPAGAPESVLETEGAPQPVQLDEGADGAGDEAAPPAETSDDGADN